MPRLLNLLLIVAISPLLAMADEVLLFPYFDSNGENGVYLAWSQDGRTFAAVNGGKPIFTPPKWPNQSLTRDPAIVWHDGEFHMVWTSNWEGNIFGYAKSTDLVDWSEPQKVQPFATGTQPKNVWAPEIFHDPVADCFRVVFSSTVPGANVAGGDPHGNNHRLYMITTRDFVEFTTPVPVLADPGHSVIDGMIAHDDRGTSDGADDRWLMVWKNELGMDQGGKNLRLAESPREIAAESFVPFGSAIIGPDSSIQPRQAAEGPSLLRWQGKWHLYWDSYGNRHYSLATSDNLANWQDESRSLRFPANHPRHGTIFATERTRVGWKIPFGAPAADK